MLRRLVLVTVLALAAFSVSAAELVRVAGYDFPPFVEDAAGKPHGLALDLITALNAAQNQYEFRFVPTSARRRYADFDDGRFDMMLFESPEWGWAEKSGLAVFSNVFLRGGEVYIALAKPGRGQEYFAELKGKRMVGILGYHYGFAGYNADPDILAANHGMKLVNSHKSSIEMVLAERVDVAVVTDSYLNAHLARAPEAARRLLVSSAYDQIYNHRALVRRGGPLDIATVNRLLAEMDKDGTLAKLWKAAGVVR
jgi:ABC-type amino acid transport substrate-binding protein